MAGAPTTRHRLRLQSRDLLDGIYIARSLMKVDGNDLRDKLVREKLEALATLAEALRSALWSRQSLDPRGRD